MATPSSNTGNTQNKPGLVSSHVEYIKGATVEAVGNLSGSQEWSSSGAHTKQHAIDDLKKASEGRDPAKDGYGTAEELAGKATGCEWMKNEGAASK